MTRENDRAAFTLSIQQDITSAGFTALNGKEVLGIYVMPDGHLIIEKTDNSSIMKPFEINGVSE